MEVRVTGIWGYQQAMRSMYMSKRSYNQEIEEKINRACANVLDSQGYCSGENDEFTDMMDKLFRIGSEHMTLLRFISFDIVTIGMHRAGQDDIDAHARRFDNRIIRESTRLSTFGLEKSTFYEGKILTDGEMAGLLGLELPDTVGLEDEEGNTLTFHKAVNGYVLDGYSDDKDVLRGLYMLSIPSNFVSQINITEFAHIYKLRNEEGGANPEVKQWAEGVLTCLNTVCPWITRDLLMSIPN